MSFISTFAEFAATASPDEALFPVLRPTIADGFGCILAGVNADVVANIHRAIGDVHTGTAPLFGTNTILAPAYAALLNAVAGHIYELDDWEEQGNTHPTVVLLPALLAAAAIQPCDGRSFAHAYALGYELISRLGAAMTLDHYARGYHATATLGSLGASAAVACLFKLKPPQIASAIALAASQAIGYTAQFGSNAKLLQAGNAARAGLECALLARTGITGNPAAVDSERGFAALLGKASVESLQQAAAKLGQPWALQEYGIVFKPWNSCGYTHRLMTAALSLDVHQSLAQIKAINAWQPDFHNKILLQRQPENQSEALFSPHACIAQMLVHRSFTLQDLAQEFWRQPQVKRLSQLTKVNAETARNPALNCDPNQPDRLHIEFDDGRVAEAACPYPLGAPQNPLSAQQLQAKYCAVSGRSLEHYQQVMDWVNSPDVHMHFSHCSHES